MINQRIIEATEDFDHIIWDWNGTLVDDVDLAVEAINVLLVENQMSTLTAAEYREVFGFPVKKYYEKLGFDFSKVSFEKLCDRFIEEYNVKRASLSNLFHGIPDLLRYFKKSKTQSILSAAAQWHLEEITEHFQIHDLFHFRFGIDNHFATSKLQRGHELIELAKVPKDKTILIGDTDHDFDVAKELGISCLLIADGHQSPQRLSSLTYDILHGRRQY